MVVRVSAVLGAQASMLTQPFFCKGAGFRVQAQGAGLVLYLFCRGSGFRVQAAGRRAQGLCCIFDGSSCSCGCGGCE